MKAKELSAKDLMIGDWVSYHGIVNRIALADFCHFEWIDKIRPIPLTSEILKKNGFEYYHKNYASLCYDHPFKLKIEKWPNENGLEGLWSITDLIKIRYVHELQHALRLCGIEKEIVL